METVRTHTHTHVKLPQSSHSSVTRLGQVGRTVPATRLGPFCVFVVSFYVFAVSFYVIAVSFCVFAISFCVFSCRGGGGGSS